MKYTTIMIATTLVFGIANSIKLEAQAVEFLAVPIQVADAQVRQVPANFLRKLSKVQASQLVEVLDLGVEVNSRALDQFPPSLQPLLHIGGNAYSVQRIEYSNWDARNEKPIDEKLAVGETQTYHFFIENWQEVKLNQPMILSVLSPEEIRKVIDGKYTLEQFNLIMPELKKKIPRYVPQEFIRLRQEK